MRTTINIDDELLERAKELTGVSETGAVVRKSLADLIARESQRRLIRLKGSHRNIKVPSRRRFG